MGWEWVQPTITLLSLVGAIIAWLAKLRWSKEYAAAKEAQIKALEAQIAGLKEMTPRKVREYFLSVRTQLEEYNEDLKGQLTEAQSQIDEQAEHMQRMEAEGSIYKIVYQEILRTNSNHEGILKTISSPGSLLYIYPGGALRK